MQQQPTWLNWSLRRLLATETGSFNIARIRILHVILLFSLIKILVVVGIAAWHHQQFQLQRAVVTLALYLVMFKLLLANKNYVRTLTHIMIVAGLLIVVSILLVSAQTVNVVALQFVFMAIVSSFYLLDKRWGIFYSVLGCMPILLFILFPSLHLDQHPEPLADPGTFILITFNFVTIVAAHYLYHQAFSANMAEKEALNAQLETAVANANKLAQSRADFLSTMSHELRTPLNAVIGISDLLLDEPANEQQKENLEVLRFSATSLHALINDILDFSKLGSEKLYLERVEACPAALVRKVCSGLELQAREKGLYLKVNLDETLENLYVITDPIRITQVIYNLVSNAIKFTPQGGVTVSLQRQPATNGQVGMAFSVSDTGIGIASEQQHTVFEPFVQASSSTTRHYGGTGLGLSIVKRLLNLFGSEIQLTSIPGKGSDFRFVIQFEPVAEQTAHFNEEDQQRAVLRGLHILVVEDNALNSFLMQKLFTRLAVNFDLAANGVEAVTKAAAATYDLILMDIHMPLLDGYEATRQIRQLPDATKANVPVMALTASVSHNLQQKIKDAGMNDYVQKPFDANELCAKVSALLPAKS